MIFHTYCSGFSDQIRSLFRIKYIKQNPLDKIQQEHSILISSILRQLSYLTFWQQFILCIDKLLILFIMSTLSNYFSENLFDIVNKPYETRTAQEHKMLIQTLQIFYPTLTTKSIKLLSFYVSTLNGPMTITSKEYMPQSFVFMGLHSENPEQITTMHNITKQSKIVLHQNQQAIFLSYQQYLNCMALEESSIQEEINTMHSSEFMCSIPKKRLYYLLRNAKVLTYSMSQCIYYEGQKIEPGESGSGVYLVRKGDFGYYKKSAKEGKQIEALRFTKGHIIGTLELGQNTHSHQSYPPRLFTVRCKSSKAIVYNFSEQIFVSQIKPYCEQYLNQRQSKLMKYLDGHIQKVSETREEKNSFLTQNLERRFSLGANMTNSKNSDLPILNRTKMSVPFQTKTSRIAMSQQLEEEGLRKTTYMSVVKDGPLKRFPMASQRSTFTQSEFKDFIRLQRNKQQCQKIRRLKNYSSTTNRGQILFTFFKKTWMFEKQKMRSRRYH